MTDCGIINKRNFKMALNTIATMLEEVQTAISKTLKSQEYELANRRQRMAMLKDLTEREEFLVKQGELKGFDATLAGTDNRGSYSVSIC